MTILESNNTIYDNAIEQHFHEYFENRGIELFGDGYKKIETNLFAAAFSHVYKKLFKPLPGEKQRYHRTSKLDYSNYLLIEEVIDIFVGICMAYNIPSRQDMFCTMTGIDRSTLFRWKNESTRGNIYRDSEGNIIRDIHEYILNNKGVYTKEPSTTYCDLIKKLDDANRFTSSNMLYDFQNGQMMIANNDPDAGMEYNKKRQVETAKVQLLTAAELPKLTVKS